MMDLPIFVINMDRSADRWAFVSQEFARVGLARQVKRFPAIDARKDGFVSPGYDPHSWRSRWELKLTERGVFESHRALWEHVAQTCPQGAVICEDDILISEDMKTVLAALKPGQFGVTKLDGAPYRRSWGDVQDVNGLRFRPIRQAVPSAGCYAVSPQAAQQLFDDSTRYCDTLDDFLFEPRPYVNAMQLWPAIAVQAGFCKDEAQPETPETVVQTARPDRYDRPNKGPLGYRVMKELRRQHRRNALRKLEDLVPPLAADLPPYRT